jgi:predicted nucleic acid-binding protein
VADGAHALVDSNVLLDIFTGDPVWADWSAGELARLFARGRVAINAVVFAEVSVRFSKLEDVMNALSRELVYEDIPKPAAFLAGKCLLDYRHRGGERSAPLPDFFIGAHAAVTGRPLLTRDRGRYETYLPGLRLIAPEA